MTSAAIASFPPKSVAKNSAEIVNECEYLEVIGKGDHSVLVVEMAALMVEGDLVAARHLWRRYRDDSIRATALEPWWSVAQCMMEWDVASSWVALQVISDGSDSLFSTYANEIVQAYRTRLAPLSLLKSIDVTSKVSSFAVLLNMTEEDCVQFLNSRKDTHLSSDVFQDMEIYTRIVAFLEASANEVHTD
ncbi:COP9 SigNalosome subunit 8 [Phaeodactylum tricornutum CCAP 1055/1]|jgi:hypothetical protein|uniref:COP9 SigNalosome subunit 8 n=2 Tax=Phaeodactylum tricornutum TaxID=2850 RepID=B7GA04_PHATC|nr:COP9 SigNalosome subunit 8 [Phaeodactylum tricornutum CCAP 1055/1]EEC44652.1 COP9 SigNalosome subunit 8 [Phaeodactylum tricornutum CCAP 1055/1]|eukprot:XP_002183983.1 COP9 SigNalosome subunit 8 [Phaeodactylum tricornutum CCAP 1055/1]